MIHKSKLEVLEILSQIDDVVFVGGTSQYLQGYEIELRDIDISISHKDFLSSLGYVHTAFDDSFYGLSGQRGFIPFKSVLVDIFIDTKRPDFIIIDGYKCETIQSIINLDENTLAFNRERLSAFTINKIEANVNKLKQI